MISEWKILSKIISGEDVIEVLAAKSEDGIGIMARWNKTPVGWRVLVWHTEMEPEGIDADDGDSVPTCPHFIFENVEDWHPSLWGS